MKKWWESLLNVCITAAVVLWSPALTKMYFGITDSIINVAGVCAIHACRLQCREREHERDIYQGGRGGAAGGREGGMECAGGSFHVYMWSTSTGNLRWAKVHASTQLQITLYFRNMLIMRTHLAEVLSRCQVLVLKSASDLQCLESSTENWGEP